MGRSILVSSQSWVAPRQTMDSLGWLYVLLDLIGRIIGLFDQCQFELLGRCSALGRHFCLASRQH